MRPNYVCHELDRVWSDAECDAAIQRAETAGFSATGGDYPPSYRDNDRLVLTDAALAASLFERLRARLPATLDGESLVGLNERFRVCRYRDGQRFRIHRDGAHAPSPHVRSRLTLQISLSDPASFEGGRTRFYVSRQGEMVASFRPARGHALLFDHDDWHDGEAVERGTKIVLRTDVLYTQSVRGQRAALGEPPARGTLFEHRGYVFALAALADGRVASGSRDRTVAITCPRRGESVVIGGHGAAVTAIVEIAPGLLVTASRDHTLHLVDVSRGATEPQALWRAEGAALSLTAIAGGGVFACGDAAGKIHVWRSLARPPRAIAAHTGWVWSLASRGQRLASGSEDGTVATWDVDTSREVARAAFDMGPIHTVTFGAAGELWAGGADGSLRALDPLTLRERFRVSAHRGEVYASCALAGGGIVTGGEDGAVRWWSPRGILLGQRTGDVFVRALARTADGRVWLGDYDGLVLEARPQRASDAEARHLFDVSEPARGDRFEPLGVD